MYRWAGNSTPIGTSTTTAGTMAGDQDGGLSTVDAHAGIRGRRDSAGRAGKGIAGAVVGDNAGMESTHEPRLEAFTQEAASGEVPGGQAPRRDVVVLGSTGSIGTQAADIVRRNRDRFRIAGLAAGGGQPDLLASQALEFGAEVVAVAAEA